MALKLCKRIYEDLTLPPPTIRGRIMGEFFAKEGVDFGYTGWITESGELIKCEAHEHDEVVKKRTGKSVGEMEKIWIRISVLYGKNHIQFTGKKLTKQQHKALDDWGLDDFLNRRRLNASKEFVEAYFAE